MTAAERLRDSMLSHAIGLQRLTNAEARRVSALLGAVEALELAVQSSPARLGKGRALRPILLASDATTSWCTRSFLGRKLGTRFELEAARTG